MIEEKNVKKQDIKNQRILLIVPMLHQGGFERVCVKTARLLEPYCDVKILIFSDEDIAFDITGLNVTNLNIGYTSDKLQKVWNVWRRVRETRRRKKEWQITISYSFGITANLVNVLSKAQDKVWVGIRGYLDVESKLHSLICRKADKIVGVSKGIQEHIQREYPRKDVTCIYNSFETEKIREMGEQAVLSEEEKFYQNTKVIAAMGREDDVKGFWHLIRVFACLQKEIPELRLVIVGEGDFLTDKAFAEKLGVKDKILFTGVRKNPFAYIKKADLFVMTSLSEGFPNSLVEAMVLGVPVISTNCPSGPAEILCEDYRSTADTGKVYLAEYGVLIPNLRAEKDLEHKELESQEEILMEQIKLLLLDENTRLHYSKVGKQRAEQFTEKTYVNALCENMEK